MDAITDAVKRASELASKVNTADIPLPPAKRQVGEKPASLPQSLARKLQDINALSFPFTDISLVQPGYGQVLERYKIPESMLTYVIGRNCEQINRIQRESNCRIYIESGPREGSTNVMAALVGSESNVKKAMGSMDITVAKGKIFSAGTMFAPTSDDADAENVEMLIPGQIAGLIIGKNGETIKNMQISTGAKMVMIQESCASTIYDKPLRIIGEPHQVQAAVKLVNEILNSKEAEGARKYGNDGQPTEFFKLQILNEKVGIVIGRGGETIREINVESGGLVEVSKAPPPNSYEQDFNIWGTRDQIITAVQMICARTQTELPPFVADQVDRINNEHYYNSSLGIYTTAAAWRQQNETANADINNPDYCINMAQYQQPEQTQTYASVQQAPQIDPLTGEPDYTLAWVEYFRTLGDVAKAQELLAQQAARQQQAAAKLNEDKAEKSEKVAEDKTEKDDLDDIVMPEK